MAAGTLGSSSAARTPFREQLWLQEIPVRASALLPGVTACLTAAVAHQAFKQAESVN